MHRPLIIGCLIIYLANAGVNGAKTKRVILGSPVLDVKRSEYLATRFFVSIGSGHNCDTPLPDSVASLFGKPKDYEFTFIKSWLYYRFGRICAPRTGHFWCTGSLLTPFVVQTACHCLADYRGNETIMGAVTRNVFEVGYTIHPARRLVEEVLTNEGVYCENFIVHPKCSKNNVTGIIYHDYALIRHHSSFEKYQKFYAPVYPLKSLAKIWLDTMDKEKVCLTIGFGRFKWQDGVKYEESVLRSDVLRHGWVQAMDYRECYNRFSFGSDIKNYSRQSTNICMMSLDGRPDEEQLKAGKGDSGGPVTCDNEYVGIVSVGSYKYRLKGYYYQEAVGADLHMSTAFSVYENSIELRDELSYRIDQLYGPSDPLRNYGISPSRIDDRSLTGKESLSSGALQIKNIEEVFA